MFSFTCLLHNIAHICAATRLLTFSIDSRFSFTITEELQETKTCLFALLNFIHVFIISFNVLVYFDNLRQETFSQIRDSGEEELILSADI